MSSTLANRAQALQEVQRTLTALVDDLGANAAADAVGVSADTIRRRIRGDQEWHFDEVIDLARLEIGKGHHPAVAHAVIALISASERTAVHPLLVPTSLREVLRLVGRLTTEIADTLEDGRVDSEEAARLLELFAQLDGLTEQLRVDLAAIAKRP